MKDVSQPTDEVTFFHKKSGFVIGGHNYQFSYSPNGYKAPDKFKTKTGPFTLNLIMKLIMKPGDFKSNLEGQPSHIVDSKLHLEQWKLVLSWDIKA